MDGRDWLNEFRLQCERNLARSVEERMRYGFCYVYKPVLDDSQGLPGLFKAGIAGAI